MVADCTHAGYGAIRREIMTMAILHVRNVPEHLYAELRERAEAERRSLSAEVVLLLQ